MASSDIRNLLGEADAGGASRTDLLAGVLEQVADTREGTAAELNQFVAQLDQLRATSQGQTEAVAQNTQAVVQNTVAQVSSDRGSALSTAGSVARTVLGNALGLSPIITGLAGLFGGGKSETPAPLAAYTRPTPVRLEAGFFGGGESDVYPLSYGQDGLPRVTAQPATAPTPQVTVQVQAMDSRSFLDHMDEIANAVKEAMLNSHSLNDVVNDL